MSQASIVSIRQLTSRLENATSSERLEALQELQVLARTEAKSVGEYALQSVLDVLKEQVHRNSYLYSFSDF